MMRRVYVSVTAVFDECGAIRPLSVRWEDGRVFEIDRLLDVRMAPSQKAGGHGTRYTVRILGRRTQLFQDEKNRWFVEAGGA